MKRTILLLLALMMALSACGRIPAESTDPVQSTAPVQTTVPAQTTPTTTPVETTIPAATESVFSAYTLRIEDPETMIYTAPGFAAGAAGLVEESGTYTIVEESADADGNRWGRLKSGAGWICLTDPPLAPIYADYAPEDFNPYHAYWEDTDYITSIGFTAGETLTHVEFGLLDWFNAEEFPGFEVFYTIDEMDPDHPFLAQVTFWGDMTTYGISFTDESGNVRHFAVSISGKDGSLICQEYMP